MTISFIIAYLKHCTSRNKMVIPSGLEAHMTCNDLTNGFFHYFCFIRTIRRLRKIWFVGHIRVMLKKMKPKCDKMVMKHEKWTPTLMPQVSEPPIQKKCPVQCKTYQTRINVHNVLFLAGFIVFSMTHRLSFSHSHFIITTFKSSFLFESDFWEWLHLVMTVIVHD